MSKLPYWLKETIVLSSLWIDWAFCHLGHSCSDVKFPTWSFILVRGDRATWQNVSMLRSSVLCLVGDQPLPPVESLSACPFGGKNPVLFITSFKFVNWEYQSHTASGQLCPLFFFTNLGRLLYWVFKGLREPAAASVLQAPLQSLWLVGFHRQVNKLNSPRGMTVC